MSGVSLAKVISVSDYKLFEVSVRSTTGTDQALVTEGSAYGDVAYVAVEQIVDGQRAMVRVPFRKVGGQWLIHSPSCEATKLFQTIEAGTPVC